MSANREEKPKVTCTHEGGGAPSLFPTAKRQKTSNNGSDFTRSLLLETQPEILRKVYSFLMLKEALVLRQTHRQFNYASNDLYQYSVLMDYDVMVNRGFNNDFIDEYMRKQRKGVYSLLSDNESLRAVLRNETLPYDLVRDFMTRLVEHSKTDNSQAVSVLVQDGRCEVNIYHLHVCLRKGFSAMAAALQQDHRVKKDIQMCRICSNNIGCYDCTNWNRCVIDGEKPRYCHECVFKSNHFCKKCNDYLCRTCQDEGAFDSCESCGGIECLICEGSLLIQCHVCERKRCKSCINRDEEVWSTGESGDSVCPSCDVSMPHYRLMSW